MDIYQLAAWGVIIGLSLMLVGGFVLWAYGFGHARAEQNATGPEAEATNRFHRRLARWFFAYGIVLIVAGTGILWWARTVFV